VGVTQVLICLFFAARSLVKYRRLRKGPR
jgi:hypothetical protein